MTRFGIAPVALLVVLFLGATAIMHHDQPSAIEHAMAVELLARAKAAHPLGEGQAFFFDISRGSVDLNAYGVVEPKAQQAIEANLRSVAQEKRFDARITLSFFPRREETRSANPDGSIVTTVKKSSPIRTIQIQ
jgi:hypothetical protein